MVQGSTSRREDAHREVEREGIQKKQKTPWSFLGSSNRNAAQQGNGRAMLRKQHFPKAWVRLEG